MKKLKLLSLTLCAALLIGSTSASAANEKLPVEEFVICTYCPETGEEEYTKCDTSFVVDQINNGARVVSTPSFNDTNILMNDQHGNEISPNDIIGDSDSRYQITNTTKKPYSAICLIEIYWRDSVEPDFGTGCMIGPNTVLTAAHCVYNKAYGGFASKVNVYPGYNGTNRPFGDYYGKRFHVENDYMAYGTYDDDWAVIEIFDFQNNATQIGNTTGYLGLDYLVDNDYEKDSLLGVSVWVTGYPGDKASGVGKTNKTMWRSGGSVTASTHDRIFHSCDTDYGDSGAPITTSSDRIIGIHTKRHDKTQNRGVRVSAEMISTIVSFKNKGN